MTLPQPATPRKRLGLWAPFAALAVAVLALSGYWLWLRAEAVGRLETLRGAGAPTASRLNWRGLAVHGFPFRLDLDFTDVDWRDGSGWGLSAPALKTEAFVFAPSHWVAVAPNGVTVTRPLKGPVVVSAKVLRASLSETDHRPPRFSLEGIDLTFTPGPGAAPYFLSAAKELHIHTKAGPDDQGAFMIELDGARSGLPDLIGAIAAGRPADILADAIYDHASALAGADWPSAVRAWSASGGRLDLRHLRLQAGEALLDAHGQSLAVGDDARLSGALMVSLRQAPRALAVLGAEGTISPEAAGSAATAVGAATQGQIAAMTLEFQAGRTTLGPVDLGPAPKVY
jgi:hypothetical protein